MSIGVSYGLLGFIYFFGEKPRTFSYFKRCIPYIGGYTLLLGVYLGTPLIISGISYDTENQVYREILGPGILLHIGLHLLCGIGLIYSSYRQLQKQIYFNKKRLKYILIGTLFPLILLIFLQLILPLFGIWILEKETILIFPTFAIYIHYTMNRWYFPGE